MPNKKPNPYDIGPIFELMTLDLINSMVRNLKSHRDEELKEGFRWEQWQRAKLRNIRAYRQRNAVIIDKAFEEAESLIEEVLDYSFLDGERNVQDQLDRIMRVDVEIRLPYDFETRFPDMGLPYELLPEAPEEESFFGINERKLEALKESVTNDINSAKNSVMRKMDDVYRQTIYKAEVNMAAGAKTLHQAIDMATKEFLQKGINVIEYKDGRRVTIGAYAEMALRTASQRATFLGEGKKRDELGVYTVLMSAHNNCSPMCLPYQGTVMIDDVYTSLSTEDAQQMARETGYTRLSVAMENHAFHPNCRHSLSTFFPGINTIPQPADDKKALANYKAEQHQRYLERGIRMYKRLYEGSISDEEKEKYRIKLRHWQSRLREHIREHEHLRRDYSRERVS